MPASKQNMRLKQAFLVSVRLMADIRLAKSRLAVAKAAAAALAPSNPPSRRAAHGLLLDAFSRAILSETDAPLDAERLAGAMLAGQALGITLAYAKHETALKKAGAALLPVRAFAENPWALALRSFVSRKVIGAGAFDRLLKQNAAAVGAGVFPSFEIARAAAYERAFTMVREANSEVLARARNVIASGLGLGEAAGVAAPNKTDLRIDLENMYQSVGLAPQDPWYSNLVVNNAANKAWQEGTDALAKNDDGEWADWVWGFQWHHGNSREPRPSHLAMHLHAAPKDDPIWATFGPPPIAHNCSCARETISVRDAIAAGLADRKDFAPPRITEEHLGNARISDEAYAQLDGMDVSEAMASGMLRGDHW